jgi:hypothetical protein
MRIAITAAKRVNDGSVKQWCCILCTPALEPAVLGRIERRRTLLRQGSAGQAAVSKSPWYSEVTTSTSDGSE